MMCHSGRPVLWARPAGCVGLCACRCAIHSHPFLPRHCGPLPAGHEGGGHPAQRHPAVHGRGAGTGLGGTWGGAGLACSLLAVPRACPCPLPGTPTPARLPACPTRLPVLASPCHLTVVRSSPLPQVGRLWTSLADYFIRRGMFERARDVYEEGLTSVVTVRDFSLVYDALTQVRRLCFVVAGLRAPVHLALALALASDAFSPGTTPTPRCILIQPQPHSELRLGNAHVQGAAPAQVAFQRRRARRLARGSPRAGAGGGRRR